MIILIQFMLLTLGGALLVLAATIQFGRGRIDFLPAPSSHPRPVVVPQPVPTPKIVHPGLKKTVKMEPRPVSSTQQPRLSVSQRMAAMGITPPEEKAA